MKRKVRIEIEPGLEAEEVIIRCSTLTPEIANLQRLAETGSLPLQNRILPVILGETEYFLPINELLFFEAADGRTAVHTVDRMYYTEKTLRDLADELPSNFVRVSKSCILNVRSVSSLKRSLTGVSEVTFAHSSKKAFVSRMYYKPFRERLLETGLQR